MANKKYLRERRDGSLTTKSILQPRADGTGLTTKKELMEGGFKPCKTCKTPGTCRLAGKCLKKETM